MTRAPLAVAVLLLGGVSACDVDDSGAPTDASVREFCEVNASSTFLTYRDDQSVPSADEAADVFREWGDELAAVGTPEGIPDDARAGFELVVTRARDGEGTGPSGGADEAKVAAFHAYVEQTCGGAEPGLPEVPELP